MKDRKDLEKSINQYEQMLKMSPAMIEHQSRQYSAKEMIREHKLDINREKIRDLIL